MKYTVNIILLLIAVLFSFHDMEGKANAAITDLEPTITITKPAGGQSYCLEENQYIRWETTGGTISTVSIRLFSPNGQNIIRTLATDIPNSGQYLWNNNFPDEGNYLIKISGLSFTSDLIEGQTGVFTLKECMKPDLQVGVIEVLPQNPGEGDRVIYKGNVMNYGEVPVVNPTVKLVLDRPGNDPPNQFTTTMDVTLGKNQGVTFEKGFKVHKHGSYTTTLILDPGNTVDELDENNNRKNWTFGVAARPDLIVYVSNAKRPPVGRDREIKFVVKNVGNQYTNAMAGFKLRTYVKQKGVKLFDIPPLDPGETYTVTRKHKWGTAGTKKITAKINYSHPEINRNNNEVQSSFFVRLPHHDKYTAAPPIKCSTGETFRSWDGIINEANQ